jgi:hypothetical protein
MFASGVERFLGINYFYGLLTFGFVASSAHLHFHGKHEIVRQSPLQAVC